MAQMSPAGYASFKYHCRIGNLSSQKTVKVACGTGNIEMVSEEELRTLGLKLPDGNLNIDEESGEISIYRSLALPKKSLSVAYSRIYPSQYGFDKMMTRMGHMLKKAHRYQPDMTSMDLSDLFEQYLVRNLGFTEKSTFSYDTSTEAWIRGRVKFSSPTGSGVLEEAEYSMGLSDGFIEEIAKTCQKNGKGISTRRRNILARKKAPLGIDTFLRMVDIRSATSEDENAKDYRNLTKCTSFIVGIALKDYIK